jgi:hypothetical protein
METHETPKRKINPHLLLMLVITFIFVVGVLILLRWNRGEISDFDPDFITTEFDVEPLDFIVLPPPQSENRIDDGILRILCLGNHPFTDVTGAEGLAALIAEATGGVTYNGAFPGSMVATNTNPTVIHEYFSLFYVTMALVNDDFSHLERRALLSSHSHHMEAVNTLSGLDMEHIDVIIIMYDTTDYNMLSPVYNPNDVHDINTFTGALRSSIEHLQEFFPHIRIIVMSHTYARYLDNDGQLHNGTITDLGHGTIVDYLLMQYDVAFSCRVTFIDNYFGTIHEENYLTYMRDHMHYNTAGRRLLANRVAQIILESSKN